MVKRGSAVVGSDGTMVFLAVVGGSAVVSVTTGRSVLASVGPIVSVGESVVVSVSAGVSIVVSVGANGVTVFSVSMETEVLVGEVILTNEKRLDCAPEEDRIAVKTKRWCQSNQTSC